MRFPDTFFFGIDWLSFDVTKHLTEFRKIIKGRTQS